MTVRILHLTGSATSAELDDLSRLYARDCLAAVGEMTGSEPLIAHVSPGGAWRFPDGLSAEAISDAPPLQLAAAVSRLEQLAPEVMVPHMFCLPGMTWYRTLFDLLGIPYVGNRGETMAVTARKDQARAVVAAAGVSVPAGVVVPAGAGVDASAGPLRFPVVVKPVDADNSTGVSLARGPADYAAAVGRAGEHGSAVLVEQFIAPGREVRCGILERGGELVCLPLEEYPLDPAARPIRTAADKLARTETGELVLVAKGGPHAWIVDADDPVCTAVWAAARRCHRALGCRHYSLFDFRIDAAGHPWFLEAGLYCSFAPKSVVATMAAAAGIPVDDLLSQMIAEALADRPLTTGRTT